MTDGVVIFLSATDKIPVTHASHESPDMLCRVCPRNLAEHEGPEVHHLFSADGQLVPRPKGSPAKEGAGNKVGVRLAPEQAIAARLAVTLQRLGVISNSDLGFVLTGVDHGNSTSSD